MADNATLITKLTAIKSQAETLKHAVYDAWKQQNADYSAAGGQVTSASALAGAKQAMNDKYGTGSVEW